MENIPTHPYAFSLIFKEKSFGETFSLLLTERLFLGGTEGTRSPEKARPGARCGLGFGDTASLAGEGGMAMPRLFHGAGQGTLHGAWQN